MKATLTLHKTPASAAYSMIEMMMVIGIVGILVGAGAVGYVSQMNRSKVNSAAQIVNSYMQQARQSAIAMRQARRVAIDAGALEGFATDEYSGARTERITIWIEGKVCEEYLFGDSPICRNSTGGANPDEKNAYALSDTDYLPDGVMIADVGGRTPGIEGFPALFYVEFNARGGVEKVYFDGQEKSTGRFGIPAVIHLTRDNEVFTVDDKYIKYTDAIADLDSLEDEILFKDFEKLTRSEQEEDDSQERYKIHTVEIVRLTGKTRLYDYAYQDPWPTDEPVK